jgi:hypothetical protein
MVDFLTWLENQALNVLGDDNEQCDSCGRCCTAVSIHSRLPSGEYFDKKSGEKCQHLTPDNRCAVWGDKEKQPEVCRNIKPNNDLCRFDLRKVPGGAKAHYQYLRRLDRATTP